MKKNSIGILVFCFLTLLSVCETVAQNKNKSIVLTTKSKSEIVNAVSQLLLDNYVYPDTAKLMSNYILKQLSIGKYKAITDPVKLTDQLNVDISTVIVDKHFQIIY